MASSLPYAVFPTQKMINKFEHVYDQVNNPPPPQEQVEEHNATGQYFDYSLRRDFPLPGPPAGFESVEEKVEEEEPEVVELQSSQPAPYSPVMSSLSDASNQSNSSNSNNLYEQPMNSFYAVGPQHLADYQLPAPTYSPTTDYEWKNSMCSFQ